MWWKKLCGEAWKCNNIKNDAFVLHVKIYQKSTWKHSQQTCFFSSLIYSLFTHTKKCDFWYFSHILQLFSHLSRHMFSLLYSSYYYLLILNTCFLLYVLMLLQLAATLPTSFSLLNVIFVPNLEKENKLVWSINKGGRIVKKIMPWISILSTELSTIFLWVTVVTGKEKEKGK